MAVRLARAVYDETDIVAEVEVIGAAAAEDTADTVEVSKDRFAQGIL